MLRGGGWGKRGSWWGGGIAGQCCPLRYRVLKGGGGIAAILSQNAVEWVWVSKMFVNCTFCPLCRLCRSAAVKSSPEIVRENCHGKCEISGEILFPLVPQETSLESAQKFSRQISRRFSRDVLQLQMPNFMTFIILQTFALDLLPS